ncbi:MAG: PH domain-containing protein [Ilumatobacteraceae bacterium]
MGDFNALLTPEQTMRSLLNSEELALYDEGPKEGQQQLTWVAPAVPAFIFGHSGIYGAIVGIPLILAVVLGSLGSGMGYRLVGLAVMSTAVLWIVIAVRLYLRTYTRYILAPKRIIKMDGIISKFDASIEWDKITDISKKQSWWGQWLDYGDIKIETANDTSDFGTMKDVPRPREFVTRLEAMRKAAKHSPLNEAALRALVSLNDVLTKGELVVEQVEQDDPLRPAGWRLRRYESDLPG